MCDAKDEIVGANGFKPKNRPNELKKQCKIKQRNEQQTSLITTTNNKPV